MDIFGMHIGKQDDEEQKTDASQAAPAAPAVDEPVAANTEAPVEQAAPVETPAETIPAPSTEADTVQPVEVPEEILPTDQAAIEQAVAEVSAVDSQAAVTEEPAPEAAQAPAEQSGQAPAESSEEQQPPAAA